MSIGFHIIGEISVIDFLFLILFFSFIFLFCFIFLSLWFLIFLGLFFKLSCTIVRRTIDREIKKDLN